MAVGAAGHTARTWNHYGQVPVRDSGGSRGDTAGREKKCWDAMAESKHIPKVLVVDDEPNIRELVQVALNFHGCTVLTAASGKAALRDAETTEPDLIVLDVMLPDLDGFEVRRPARARGNDVPIIFLTARDTSPGTVQGLGLGGDDYVTKPFSVEALVARSAPSCAAPRARRTSRRRTIRPRCRLATCNWTNPAGQCTARGRRSSCRRPSSGCWPTSCGTRAASSPGRSCSRTCGAGITRASRRSSRRTSVTCGVSSIPSGRRSFTRSAASGTRCGRRNPSRVLQNPLDDLLAPAVAARPAAGRATTAAPGTNTRPSTRATTPAGSRTGAGSGSGSGSGCRSSRRSRPRTTVARIWCPLRGTAPGRGCGCRLGGVPRDVAPPP